MAHYPIQNYSALGKLKVHSGIFMSTFAFASFQVLTKIGISRGINQFVYPFYQNLIAFVIVALLAFFSDERTVSKPLTPWLLLQFFLLGFIGISLTQSMYLAGLLFTSPTVASAFQNSIPTIVFIIATICGFEELNWRRKDGAAKVGGAIFGVGGAAAMAIYKGPALHLKHGGLTWLLKSDQQISSLTKISSTFLHISTWQLGALALLISCTSLATWTVLQAPTLNQFPARLTLVAYIELFATIQLFAFAIWQEPNTLNWKITNPFNLFIVLYAGVIGSAFAFTIKTWCVQQAGPVLASGYQPLQTVMVGMLALPILGEDLHLGSIVGATLIIIGLYMITWGQSEEKRICEESNLEKYKMEYDCKIQVFSLKQPLIA